MRALIEADPWVVEQRGFEPADHRAFESLFSLGNGHFGGRGNHEEAYSGDTLQGNYIGGVYYPDPTRVGWWKNGYPEYFAKILNAPDWKALRITIDGEQLDLAAAEVLDYRRTLRMRTGELERAATVRLRNGHAVELHVERFVSMTRRHVGALRYRLTVSDAATVEICSLVDGDVVNEDSNYDEGFWDEVEQLVDGARTTVVASTKKTEFLAATAAEVRLGVDGAAIDPPLRPETSPRVARATCSVDLDAGQTVEIVKIGAIVTSRDVAETEVPKTAHAELDEALAVGFDLLQVEHRAAWERKWEISDVVIGGDPAAQQGIRFNIFTLNSTFTGDDPDLNIGPKGFTGEKYGGVTYWDTEAFCFPFYLASSEHEVAKNLLRYRYRHLGKAVENAAKLGFGDGAALFPMVTINGEECHNEWEITFEEIHRNGAIAFAIFNYIRYTGDDDYLLEGGLEVLVAISRFWSQRVSWSEPRQAWVMLGVTGPNEYENNVDNNWYTNLIAQWTLRYTLDAIDDARTLDATRTRDVLESIGFDESTEPARWREVADHLHLPHDDDRGVFLQQDNYLEKEQVTVDDLDPDQRPINQHWSWDRILRSPYIKQADVLQGLWTFEDRFDLDTLRRNFDYYEPRTVHESSLSPSVHAVLAVRLGRLEKAHELMLRTARLDLDDYNHEVDEGCHVTSMAGTWIAAVHGFGGLAVVDGELCIDPVLAPGWDELGFQVQFRGAWISVTCRPGSVTIENRSDQPVAMRVAGRTVDIDHLATVEIATDSRP
ncbi:MAG: family 65 glycosyl hydrolase domain-containing protein [Ilumatobacter sp.]|uniref:family 65 glycosyl hydrolase domain-containing protein n=1 Tax=Ilumatobacter sp. TaxID=1967498 RepID=UPI00261CB738|nr:family 65 glycosyl hydrolase domain-containing protein [Ilumatobacter sp.]MDJ0770941.1 family 65 glycosyl hydrolase domain-containing protein [Ilumatobacter sp.]